MGRDLTLPVTRPLQALERTDCQRAAGAVSVTPLMLPHMREHSGAAHLAVFSQGPLEDQCYHSVKSAIIVGFTEC